MTTDASPIQRLLEEIHQRSMWQILGVYLGSSWGVLEVVGQLIERLILPESVFRMTIVLLAIGLPIMLATAYFEGSRSRRARRPAGGGTRPVRPRPRLLRLFTWRNALLGGVAAFALLGIAASAFLASRTLGVGFAAPLIAQGVLDERETLLLADFENRTADPLLARAVTEALRVDLSQSSALRLVDPAQVRSALERMQRDPDGALDEELAREVARRDGVKAVMTGAVDQLGASYTVSARLVSAGTGEDLVAMRESADGAEKVIQAVDRLSRELRARIGESLGSVNATAPLPDVTTASLAALERFAAGSQALRSGDRMRAIRLLEEAVRLDTTFASAYRGLSVAYANLGDMVSSDRSAALARRYAERLPLRERYLSAAAYHAARGRRDSVALYYERLLDADPDQYVPVNNLADTYEWMGRFEEALALYRRAAALSPDASAIRVNLASIGRTLGLHELADSAVAAMVAAGEHPLSVLPQRAGNAIYAQRDAEIESLIATIEADPDDTLHPFALSLRAMLHAKRGWPARAMVLADTSAARVDEAGISEVALMIRLGLVAAGIAGDEPAATIAQLERWDVDGTLQGAPVMHSMALGLLARTLARADRPGDAERILARADSLAAAEDFHQPGAVANARAVLALTRGDAEAALGHVDRAIEADFGLVRYEHRLSRALAFEALGRHREAGQEFEALSSSNRLFWMDLLQFPALLPYAHERAGAAWLAAGDTAAALRHLGAFTELWSDAEPALQPRVRAATATIEAILRKRG